MRWGLVARNVADLVDPPRNRYFEIATLSPEQARAILDTAAGDRLEALYVLALSTGMRQGEILGYAGVTSISMAGRYKSVARCSRSKASSR